MKLLPWLVPGLFVALLRAVVVCQGWNWFLAPHGAPNIGVLETYATLVVVALAGSALRAPRAPDDRKPRTHEDMLVLLLVELVGILLAWAVLALAAVGVAS